MIYKTMYKKINETTVVEIPENAICIKIFDGGENLDYIRWLEPINDKEKIRIDGENEKRYHEEQERIRIEVEEREKNKITNISL